ncbi:hypothetical protein Leryth_017439 [Lithospermum erythrorhizon]|nr:hypothetical protein Leryth_017439 [Lithospermum erythrorhizon]
MENSGSDAKEKNMVFKSKESYVKYADEAEVELGLGLSLGVGQYSRIVKEKEFIDDHSTKSCSSSSSSSSSGTKRGADSVSPPCSGVSSQVVGWPPIRAYRMNSLTNHVKPPISEEFSSSVEKHETGNNIEKSKKTTNEERLVSSSLLVKVNMDGHAIGRKVDVNAHGSYEALAKTLDDMFHKPNTTMTAKRRLDSAVQGGIMGLLDGSSDFVLTYEDKDGDWMLVGDVPWEMFLNSVKRLRIMKTSGANGLGPRCQERSGRQRIQPI